MGYMALYPRRYKLSIIIAVGSSGSSCVDVLVDVINYGIYQSWHFASIKGGGINYNIQVYSLHISTYELLLKAA
jgi:hypothetical protein